MWITSALTLARTLVLSTLLCPLDGLPQADYGPHLDIAWDLGPGDGPAPPHDARRTIAGDAARLGVWSPPLPWDVIAIHAAMLPNGKVLHYSYPSEGAGSRARLWDPTTGAFTNVNLNTDIFCSGLSFLADGSLYVTGGNDYDCDFQGRTVTNLFNPFTETWTQPGDMSVGRWYPTNLTLGDGLGMITSGLDTTCELTSVMEMYTPGVGLEVVEAGARALELYPRLHLLTSGKVAHVGPENQAWTFDPNGGGWEFVDWNNLGWRCQGTSVLIPGRTDEIMIMGGNCPVTSSCEIIDYSDSTPQWHWTTSMHHPRAHADALILPDKTVMVVGGGTDDLYGAPVNIPELFDPDTGTWTELPPHFYGRMYHGTTLLLPDATVLIAGQDYGSSMFRAEIYEPAYLFAGERPEISAAPERVAYNRPFSIACPQAGEIAEAALLALSTVTHSVNNTQRYVGLDAASSGPGVLSATGPLNGNHAPPGYYMLFVLNEQGVPAVARIVQVGDWAPGDLDGNGHVDPADLAIVLGNWGLCPGCEGDVNGDGQVNPQDLALLLGNWG